MIEFLNAYMAPVMFAGLIVFLLMGFSVAFSLAACGLMFGFIGIELGMLPASLMQALPLRVFGIMQNDTLLKPKARPQAASENATENPINRKTIRPANITGAM